MFQGSKSNYGTAGITIFVEFCRKKVEINSDKGDYFSPLAHQASYIIIFA